MGRLGGLALVATVLLALALAMPTALAQPAAAAPEKRAPRLIPLEVVVNGARSGTWLLLESEGALFAPRDAFDPSTTRACPTRASTATSPR